MIKKINGLVILTTITALSLLGACGSEENSSEVQANEGRQDYSPEDFKKISDGFEEYSVWIETSNTPSRESSIRALFVFSDENLTSLHPPLLVHTRDHLYLAPQCLLI